MTLLCCIKALIIYERIHYFFKSFSLLCLVSAKSTLRLQHEPAGGQRATPELSLKMRTIQDIIYHLNHSISKYSQLCERGRKGNSSLKLPPHKRTLAPEPEGIIPNQTSRITSYHTSPGLFSCFTPITKYEMPHWAPVRCGGASEGPVYLCGPLGSSHVTRTQFEFS